MNGFSLALAPGFAADYVAAGAPPAGFTYLRPDGTSLYFRPDGTSNYLRP